MKRIFSLILILLMLCSCAPKPPQTTVVYQDDTPGTHPDSDLTAEVTILQYTWDGWGISTKTIGEGCASELSRQLALMDETGETEAAISDQIFDTGSGSDCPAEPGTFWIQTADALYRLNLDSRQVCRVERHYGEGTVLNSDDAFFDVFWGAWYFYPMNTYLGSYENGVLTLSHVYQADSDIELTVKDLALSEDGTDNTITLSLVSKTSGEINVRLNSLLSSDQLGIGDTKLLTPKTNRAEALTLSFSGWPDARYEVNITAGNTRIIIYIAP